MPRPRGTGSLYQQKDSAVWWIKYHRNGRSFRESTRTTDKRKASRALAKRLAEINTGSFVGPVYERITVGELAEDLFRDYRINGRKTTSDVETRWRLHLEPFFASRRVDAREVDRHELPLFRGGERGVFLFRVLHEHKFRVGRDNEREADVDFNTDALGIVVFPGGSDLEPSLPPLPIVFHKHHPIVGLSSGHK
ncbi:MAG: hypothetical protein ACLPY1_10920 [Terracidiphilus sp.]